MARLNKEKKIVLSKDRTIIFDEHIETKKSQSQDPAEAKPVRRGVWFFENEKKSLVPLPDIIAAEIEYTKKDENKSLKIADEFQDVEGLNMKINIKDGFVTIKKDGDETIDLKLQRGLSGEDEIRDVIGK